MGRQRGSTSWARARLCEWSVMRWGMRIFCGSWSRCRLVLRGLLSGAEIPRASLGGLPACLWRRGARSGSVGSARLQDEQVRRRLPHFRQDQVDQRIRLLLRRIHAELPCALPQRARAEAFELGA